MKLWSNEEKIISFDFHHIPKLSSGFNIMILMLEYNFLDRKIIDTNFDDSWDSWQTVVVIFVISIIIIMIIIIIIISSSSSSSSSSSYYYYYYQ